MRTCSPIYNALVAYRARNSLLLQHRPCPLRGLLTLAIETSCDDTSVAILEKSQLPNGLVGATLLFHKKVTSNNTAYHGVHPLISLESHQENLASLVEEAVQCLPTNKIPDFVAVTRGPGMRSNLATGLDTAKGLAVAWKRDIVGVHHMQAHALTPRLVAALENTTSNSASLGPSIHSDGLVPDFPFLSVLASGGHTLLIHSETLIDHHILASTNDIAVGDCLDKVSRAVLPPHVLQTARTTMYGALLETFAFAPSQVENVAHSKAPRADAGRPDVEIVNDVSLERSTAAEYQAIYRERYSYTVPKNNEEAVKRNTTKWGWAFQQPLSKAAGGTKRKSMEMSFSGLLTAIERAVRFKTDLVTGKLTKLNREHEDISTEERRDMAREAMRAAFEHIANRVVLGLQYNESLTTVVMAGGVAANTYLRFILASTLCSAGYSHVSLVFPPPSLCTDNAAMIAWAGCEMYDAGYNSSRAIRALRKWPLDKIVNPPNDD
ncbi:glycoprotease family-domain-containing protein [Dendryphion nanum]|uniref:N(6)-L-threonylcarbamoyladenine synthase n=1 Tax=Dendryphion nanum TaxID=256645 RepID=A0A9P9DWL4_9PLEO|nr:glycoprotease family-domain-containing protein [Dendryphion nanum]